jgi:O-glycosyl hydrolase
MKEFQFGKDEVNTPLLTYNALDKSHTISGFGGQIWMGDSRAFRIAEDQGWSMVRMSIEDTKPDGSKPRLSKPKNLRAEYDTYWNQLNTERIKNFHTILASKGITPIYVQFGIDPVWLDNKKFVISYVNELAEYWAAHVVWMKKNRVTPKYIELFNEPDGDWNGQVMPSDYNSIVKAVKRILDERGCSATQIVGPGRAHFDVGPSDEWVDALDADGIRAINTWSIHSYEWGKPEDINNPQYVRDNWNGFLNSVKAKDPSHSKPIFLTEHATKCRTFHNRTYDDNEKPNPDNFASNTQYYGVRVFENALSFINMGANGIIVWEACDQDWEKKSWGLEKLDGTKRPVYYAMKTLSTVVPAGAFVLKSPPQAKTEIYAAAFTTDDRFIAAFANGTAEHRTVTVNVNNASISFLKAEAMINGAIESKFLTVANNSFIVDLPGDSTLVVTLALSS